ncbi:hypothetical protein [Sessilibacter corallicola]|uniref:MSHA biogenesis protein MshJ n=1 Tax=Sessilibacter corallicola TaxID=2904075 RepID=A0ABQ0AAK2_9GAMM
MKSLWLKLSKTQQNQLLILITAVMLAGYGLWYSDVYKDIADTENRINRRLDRIENRAETVVQPKSTVGLEKQIEEISGKFEQDKQSLRRLLQRFTPIENSQEQQKLRRELSDLANSLGMRVIKLEGSLKRSDDINNAPEVDQESDVDRVYGRPLLIFEAWGSYFAVQTLLDELNTLSYTVAPIRFQVIADEPNMNARQALEVQQLLRVEMVLAI